MPRRRPEPRTPIEAVGKELEALRGLRGISQEELAPQLSLSRSGYNLYERGVRGMPLDKLFLAAEILGTTVTRILLDAESDYGSVMPGPKVELRRIAKAERRSASPDKDASTRRGSSKGQG